MRKIVVWKNGFFEKKRQEAANEPRPQDPPGDSQQAPEQLRYSWLDFRRSRLSTEDSSKASEPSVRKATHDPRCCVSIDCREYVAAVVTSI
jgi:hypothetical protein